MKDDELIALAAECGLMPWVKHEHVGGTSFSATDEGIDGDLAGLIQFAKLVAAHERNKLAAWMMQFGFATGHGDTMEQLCDALGTEIVDRIDGEVEAAIRARSQ
jgi:hypothetical protein